MKIAIVGIMDTNMANTMTMMIKSVLIFLPSGRPCLCPYEGSIFVFIRSCALAAVACRNVSPAVCDPGKLLKGLN
jgi:hypothetical protein